MEKPSGSGIKRGFVSSPAEARPNKQKATAASNIDDNKQTKRIQSQSQNLNTDQTHPLSQIMDQLDQNPLASWYDDKDQLTQTSKNTDQNQDQILTMEVEIAETDAQLEQAYLKNDRLRAKLGKVEHDNKELRKFIDGEVKTRNELIEKQNISESRGAVFRDQTVALQDTLARFQKDKDELQRVYHDVISKQYEKIKNLKEKLNGPLVSSEEEKDLEDQLRLKVKEISHAKIRRRQLENQVVQITQKVYERNCKLEELKKIIEEDQQKHDTEMEAFSHNTKNIKVNLKTEQEENSKLSVRNNEILVRFTELDTKFQALQCSSTEYAKQVEDLKSSTQEQGEEQKKLMSKIDELKSTNLAIISERDLEFADYSKQLQDLALQHTETTNKLVEITSNNEQLSDTVPKTVQQNEELKKALLSKNDELKNLRGDLIEATLINKKLSAESQSLAEKLIAQKKVLLQTETDLKTADAEIDASSTRVAEIKTRLATAKQELKNKIADKVDLRKKLSAEKSRSLEQRKKFERENEQKDKRIDELRKIRENRQRENDRIVSENRKKLQQMKNLSMQCERAGHEKLIGQKKMKIDILKQQIAAEKLKLKQENINKTNNKKTEEREAHVKQLQTDIDHIKQVISATEEQQKNLRATLTKAEYIEKTGSSIVQQSGESSPLVGVIYGKNKSRTTSSTPENSPRTEDFVIDSFSDISSIGGGSDIFEEAERRYSQIVENNKTDNAKLNQLDGTDKSDQKKPYLSVPFSNVA